MSLVFLLFSFFFFLFSALEKGLVDDKVLDGFVGDSHVVAELVDREGLVICFVELLFDFAYEFSGVSFASSGYSLDVFGVDAKSVYSCFHGFLF